MHDYFVSKTRQVAGMAPTESVETTDDSELDLGTQE